MNKNESIQSFKVFVFLSAFFSSGFIWAQGCSSATQRSAPDSRYQDNGDGTVTDLQVKLMWQRCSLGQSGKKCSEGTAEEFSWHQSFEQAEALNKAGGFAGHTDWRVPTRGELDQLAEKLCWSPAINTSLFPNTPSSSFWSASAYTGYAGNAWYMNFSNGKATYNHKKVLKLVRLVRNRK